MAKRQKLELRDVLALFSMFGPQADAERQGAQRSQTLQQIASVLGIAQGAQELEEAPKTRALQRRASEASINATESGTRTNEARLPVELEQLRAQIGAASGSQALSAEQLSQLKALFPNQQKLGEIQLQGAQAELAEGPAKRQREAEAHTSEIDYRKTAGRAAETQAAAALMPNLEGLLTLAGGTGTGKPGELVMTPERRREVMARLLQVPGIADAFSQMQGQREQITAGATQAAQRPAPNWNAALEQLKTTLTPMAPGFNFGLDFGKKLSK